MVIEPSSLGALLRDTRTAHALSLHEVADRAACSSAYVHKLEMDRVRTPSPRVLARLAEALGLDYEGLMKAAGYHVIADAPRAAPSGPPGAVKPYSNAHIVELLETLRRDVSELKALLPRST